MSYRNLVFFHSDRTRRNAATCPGRATLPAAIALKTAHVSGAPPGISRWYAWVTVPNSSRTSAISASAMEAVLTGGLAI